MARNLTEPAANVPTGERGLRRLERLVEAGELEDLGAAALPSAPRYLVTYMNSQTAGRVRSGTVVSITNQAPRPNAVTVSWFLGFSDNSTPEGVSTFLIPPDFTVDFGSRTLPPELTVVNAVPAPELLQAEGRAVVSARLPEIGVSARVYYTSGDGDEQLLAITDSKVVRFGGPNLGD
jgi:hypothetical protein